MGKECVQEDQAGEASEQMLSEGAADARAERSTLEAVMPEGAAGPAEMAIDTQAPAPAGTVPARCIATLPSSAHMLSPKDFRNIDA